ncbi:hypothetical protein F2Q69_00055367 [Brassica cretica]|uniref:Uncharacterized protein n=1 Tax=Brassica cretica TaxID=69181 RepID=A0A8S9MWA5_BRACR|nr:hypothetical protein F2Q69_00055367 [Brassica cretica]
MPRGEWQWHICRGRGCWVMGHQGQGLCPFALTLVSFGLNHCNLPAQTCDHSVQALRPFGLGIATVRPTTQPIRPGITTLRPRSRDPSPATLTIVEETTQAYHPPNDYAYGLYGSMVRPQPRLHSSIRRPPGPS